MSAESLVPGLASDLAEVVRAVKPRLRGWLHLVAAPLALAAGVVLVVLAPPGSPRLAALVFAVTSVVLFATSAAYHIGSWSPQTSRLLKRLDHSNIFLVIAGTYTPLAVALLAPAQTRTLLWVVWVGAGIGALSRVLWVAAPRWAYTPAYVLLGWVAVFYFPELLATGGWWVVSLIAAGGLMYTLGALVYAAGRPNPSPRFYGHHEVFHTFTLVGYTLHWVSVLIAVLALG